jgi:hypothetical protein
VKHYEPKIKEKLASANFGNGEPLGFAVTNMGGSGGPTLSRNSARFSTHLQKNWVRRAVETVDKCTIMCWLISTGIFPTPPDTYRPDKVTASVDMDTIQKNRNADIQQSPLFIPSL